MTANEVIEKLASHENAENVAGLKRFGIITKKAFGVHAPILKNLAREIKRETENRHELALELWATEVHEARIIAVLIDDARKVDEKQMNSWARDFDNWAICDSTCGHLFRKTEFAYQKAFEWSEMDEEFVKRAGIVLMAQLAVHDKKASDECIAQFLPLLEKYSGDERNFIKKAVNWSLRQIGKRNLELNTLAVETAERIKAKNSKAARWIAADALRELKNEKTIERLRKKSRKNFVQN